MGEPQVGGTRTFDGTGEAVAEIGLHFLKPSIRSRKTPRLPPPHHVRGHGHSLLYLQTTRVLFWRNALSWDRGGQDRAELKADRYSAPSPPAPSLLCPKFEVPPYRPSL
jgi:hypothetical protein